MGPGRNFASEVYINRKWESDDYGRRSVRPYRTKNIQHERKFLSSQKIREERERQRLRERERELRKEERRCREIRKRQREEEHRLAREREELALERERLKREKVELLRLERGRQKLKRTRTKLERQQMKLMELSSRVKKPHKRSLKRSSSDRYTETGRKRSASDKRFEAPPPPKFDSSLARSSEKRREEYGNSSKRDELKRDNYKREVEVLSSRHSSSYHSSHGRSETSGHKKNNTWENQVRILNEAVDDITTIDDFLAISENHILEDVNKCVLALQKDDTQNLRNTAGAIQGRSARVCNVIEAEMDNYEPCIYTKRVLEAIKVLRNQVMSKFAQRVDVAVEALSSNSKDVDENDFIDASRLVYDGTRGRPKKQFITEVKNTIENRDEEELDPEDIELDEHNDSKRSNAKND